MKKALVLILAALVTVFLLSMTAIAYAADPAADTDTPYTFDETDPGRTANPPDQPGIPSGLIQPPGYTALSGGSAWAYMDASDSAAKYEGSYEPFQDAANNLYDYDNTGRDSGPHGGYATTTQKCKVCHAVHRANGAYALLRVDDANDACSYCHVGDHRHSVVSAYWEAGTIYPSNGHTICAGKDIPDSSTWQWRGEKTLENLNNQTGEMETHTFEVRRYLETRVKLFRYNGSTRVGPNFLHCMNCHQVHNASDLIWKPYDSTGSIMTYGYKLLRKDPSGLIAVNPADILPDGTIDQTSTDAMTRSRLDNSEYHGGHGAPEPVKINAVDSDYTGEGLTAGVVTDATQGYGDPNSTGYTRYLNPGMTNGGMVQEVTMAVWCANCHNLNIAGKEEIEPNWGTETMLSDRSHVVPMAYTARLQEAIMGSQCYSCHNGDIPRVGTAGTYTIQGVPVSWTNTELGCKPCHVSPPVYRRIKQTYRTYLGVAGGNSLADWPHSGNAAGYKLLNDVNGLGIATNNPEYFTAFRPGSGDALDKICGMCHLPDSGSHAVGVTK